MEGVADWSSPRRFEDMKGLGIRGTGSPGKIRNDIFEKD
jgi:hypothetical protein